MKDHEKAQLVNKLRDIAIEFHNSGQLRSRIQAVLIPALSSVPAAPVPAASVQPDAELVKRLTHERDALGQAIADAAMKAGMYNGEVPLTGPHLIMFAQHLGEAAAHTPDSGRDAALVQALQIIAGNAIEVFDEELSANVIVPMSAEEMVDVAEKALAAHAAAITAQGGKETP